MDIDKILALLIEDARRMWQFRWPALLCAWLAAMGGWLFVRSLPDNYGASTRVYVNAGTALKPLLQGLTVPTDPLEQVNLMTKALLSRPHLETVATQTGLSRRARDQEHYEGLLRKLGETIIVSKSRDDNVYTISYSDRDPRMAKAVVQTLLEDFMAKPLTEDVAQSVEAQKFLEAQISINEKRLTEAEDKLADFKKRYLGFIPGQSGDFYGRYQAAQAAVETLQSQINSLANRRNELARQLACESSARASSVEPGGGAQTSVDGPIANLERELQQLRLKFTDKHPDIVRVKQTLQDLYNIRDEEIRNRRSGLPMQQFRPADPVYQQTKIALSQADADLAALRAQLREKSAQLSYLRGMANTIPEVEAQLNRLNRDYNVVKAEYETLLQRLESAKMNQEVQQDNKNVLFKVLDPPHTPMEPASPNRLALNSMVLVGSFGLGLIVAFLLSQRDPTFFSASSLREVATLPIYGMIGDTQPTGTMRGEIRFGVAIAALVVAYAIVVVFGNPAVPVAELQSAALQP